MEQAAIHKLHQMRQRYIGYQLVAGVFVAIACALLAGSVSYYLLPGKTTLAAILVFFTVLTVVTFIHRPWKTSLEIICSYLNLYFPQLEESSQLIIKPADKLNLLEQLQVIKLESAIVKLPGEPAIFTQQLKKAAWLFAAALIISIAILKLGQFSKIMPGTEGVNTNQSAQDLPPEKILPQIDGVLLKIAPPAYTGKPARTQDKFTINAEEGALVSWNISTNIEVKNVFLLFNEREKIALNSANKTDWQARRIISKPGFYQVSIDGKLSDLYQIQVIKDAIPVIHIKSPKQYTHIDAGEAQRVAINTTVTDDYGINNVQIFATIAKGSGESVKFKDTIFSFSTPFSAHRRRYDLQRTIDLPKLNMEPGDELYFYIQAVDTHQQKSRTDVLIVSIQDTAQLLSMDGIVAAANIKPEYFRSQRQIILDTEKLLKEKDSISTAAFKNRCNELGTDQKLLRLRYGKFLGEEDESGTEGEDNEEIGKAENFGNAKMVMDAFTDKHDNAEDATFLEPAAKSQLKATLNEMWKAELRLRLYKPQDALPFEYKALRLLKDLQQKSRSYVAKTNYNPPPIKTEKRLSGDLSKIAEPVNQQIVKPATDRFEMLKIAARILEQSKHKALSVADKRILELAAQQLAQQASTQPGVYLKAVGAVRRILANNKQISVSDRSLVEMAIQRSLPESKIKPSATGTTADMGLGQRYFNNLNR
ncbi:DUF4175 family protein [Mucilaginibacter aquatilis]|uniref:DUF4175 family protein n=1 Tax=Mucilaginibacter aquatilis TaxID=1517760 RepID=A0A6I4I736_9SPHI|nr:DUF4175 family protein [Mucilaginibacter aquatilis]MVN90911.1 hypothetical protein [Mucilaginibacter aquatilis]